MMKNMIILAILLCTICTVQTVSAEEQMENITMANVTFTVPHSGSAEITNASNSGGYVFTYYDEAHNLTVYVCDDTAPEYDTMERWNEYEGYSQKMVVGNGKTVVVIAESPYLKDDVLKSLVVANATNVTG